MKFRIEEALEILAATPATIDSLLGDLSGVWVEARADEQSWNAFDVVGHLIHGEETDWIARARIIIAQGENPAFEPFDRFAQFEKSKGKTMPELLAEFAELRRENLAAISELNLTPDRLRLKGIHPEFGEVTLEQLLATWVVHDLTHIRQIVTALARQYDEAVGPWRAYLSILR